MNTKISGKGLNSFYNTTPVTVTGTSVQTVLQSVFIPAGTYEAGDLLIVRSLMSHTGTENVTNRLYSSPNDPSVSGITGATQLWISIQFRSFFPCGRHLYIKNTTGGGSGIELGTELKSTSEDTLTDMSSGLSSNIAINWSNGVYLFTTGTITNVGGESITQLYLKIWDY